jgi:hypothetical protein
MYAYIYTSRRMKKVAVEAHLQFRRDLEAFLTFPHFRSWVKRSALPYAALRKMLHSMSWSSFSSVRRWLLVGALLARVVYWHTSCGWLLLYAVCISIGELFSFSSSFLPTKTNRQRECRQEK